MKFRVECGAIRHAVGSQRKRVFAAIAAGLLGCAGAVQAAPKIKPTDVAVAPQGPLLVVVSIGEQRLSLYDRNGRVLESPISSGRTGFDTPQGVFAVIERNREHFSNLYDDAPMPNMQRITWSGVAMHAGRLPGFPASHGCIRLPMGVSERLFEMTKLGTRVVVAEHDVTPASFEHPKLFSRRSDEGAMRVAAAAPRSERGLPTPMAIDAGSSAPASVLPAMSNPFADLPAGMTRAGWAAELTFRAQQADTRAKPFKAKSAAAAKDAARAMAQVLAAERRRSALAAKVNGLEAKLAGALKPAVIARLEVERDASLVRLGEWLIEIDRLRLIEETKTVDALKIVAEADAVEQVRAAAGAQARDANRSLKPVSVFVSRQAGRLYVRQGFQPLFDVPVTIANSSEAIGTHVYTALDSKPGLDVMEWSAVTTVGATPEVPAKRRRGATNTASRPALTAAAALDRVDIPDEVRQRVGLMLMPGSSLIISDESVSVETGKGTDFVVLTR